MNNHILVQNDQTRRQLHVIANPPKIWSPRLRGTPNKYVAPSPLACGVLLTRDVGRHWEAARIDPCWDFTMVARRANSEFAFAQKVRKRRPGALPDMFARRFQKRRGDGFVLGGSATTATASITSTPPSRSAVIPPSGSNGPMGWANNCRLLLLFTAPKCP